MENNDEKIQCIEIVFQCKQANAHQIIVLSSEHSAYQFLASNKIEGLEKSEYIKGIIRDIQPMLK